VQTTVLDEERGRISASANAVFSMKNVVSMAFAGMLSEMVGVRNVFIVSGVIVVLSGLITVVFFRGEETTSPKRVPQPDSTPASFD
jgi:predicted MFS family arabinose efflux permease